MKKFFTNKFVVIGVFLVFATEVALLSLIASGVLLFKNDLTFSAFTVIPLFIVAIIQLVYNSRLQKTDFVRDYSEEFFTNEALYSAFHDLVYCYKDDDFKAVEQEIEKMQKDGELTDESPRPIKISIARSIGNDSLDGVLFHPKWFQGSSEECRLDMLIGYFDLLGYHLERGFITIEDLAGSLGHYLNILSRRAVIKCMRSAYREAVKDPEYAKRNGRIAPFPHFENLMIKIEEYNQAIEDAIEKNLKIPTT